MNKQIIMICMILMIGVVSAETVYSGDSITFNLSEAPSFCKFAGDYQTPGLEMEYNSTQVTVTTNKMLESVNVTLQCFKGEEVFVEYSFGGGSSSSSSSSSKPVEGNTTIPNETEATTDSNVTEQTETVEEDGQPIFWIIVLTALVLIIGGVIYKFITREKDGEEITQDN